MSELVDKAIIAAVNAHSGQTRKLSKIPYILHPLEVANIIATITTDENVIAAGILHDTVEDTDMTPEEVREQFGPRVAAIVASDSEDKLSTRPPEETWMQRKEESLLMLSHTKDRDVKIMWLGDKLSNIRSMYYSYVNIGDELFNNFHQKDKKMHEWYYRTILDYLSELSDYPAWQEYKDLVNKIFGEE